MSRDHPSGNRAANGLFLPSAPGMRHLPSLTAHAGQRIMFTFQADLCWFTVRSLSNTFRQSVHASSARDLSGSASVLPGLPACVRKTFSSATQTDFLH